MQDNATGVINASTSSVSHSVTPGVTTPLSSTTTTRLPYPPDFYDPPYQNYDEEGTIHLVAVVSSIIVFIGLIFTIKSIIGFIRSPRRSTSNSSNDVRPGPSFLRWLADDPPPYPGKYSRTNVNYLPSYESALEIERERQRAREAENNSTRDVVRRALESAEVASSSSDGVASSCGSEAVVFTVAGDSETSLENRLNVDGDIQGATGGSFTDPVVGNHTETETDLEVQRDHSQIYL